MNVYSAQLRAALWWLLPLLALAAMIGWETDWGKAVDKHPPPPEPIAPKPVVSSLLPDYEITGGVAARGDTVQRTLFNPTRRPAPPAPQEGAAGRLQRGQFALTGTTIVDGKNTAFLRELNSNKSRHVRAGESVNGMRVADVKPDRVTLAMGDETEELTLKVVTNPRPTPQVASAPVPGAVPAQPAPTTNVPGARPGPPAAAAVQVVPQPGETPMSMAERRRAARAAQAAASAAAAGATADASAAPPPPPAAPPAQATWDQVYQNMQKGPATPQTRRSTK